MTALEHRTAAALARAKQRDINIQIRALPLDTTEYEFNQRIKKLDVACLEWRLIEEAHTQAAQRLAAQS
jgi:hypothetical protein